MTATTALVLDARADLGEGALWDSRAGVLYWVDIMVGRLHVFDPARGDDRVFEIGQHVGTVVPRRSGGVLLALHHGIAAFDPETGKLDVLCDPEADRPGNRFNDGKCDPAGRFWAGTMAIDCSAGKGSLYRLDADRSLHRVLSPVSVSNGIVWSLDARTMYYTDTLSREVWAFDYDLATGAIANRRTAIRIPEADGLPDGMTIDAEGMLWVAHWGGGRVTRWDPRAGRLLDTIRVPASQVTSCAFGGPDLGTLYITSARRGLDANALAREPMAGALFCAKLDVIRGVPATEYAG
jgi:sugar lactone lactonase YvrE